MKVILPEQPCYRIVQITDCHLLAEIDGVYQGCQPAVHLQQVVTHLQHSLPDAVVLTGDLTQDHSCASYQLLADILAPLTCPVLLLPGNHDDIDELQALAARTTLQLCEALVLAPWQVFLLNSKGATPSGSFALHKQVALQQQFAQSTQAYFWLFMHHHPQPLGCFIDKHGLIDRSAFWALVDTETRIKGIGHGHAHLAYHTSYAGRKIVGCPASSVQFLATDDWQTVNAGAQWCEWLFSADGEVSWSFRHFAQSQ
ncbi:metallophosphoesterase [Alishewanella tabrizica]|uniref:3',5'-cyclic adenosine monophosphate phosphodiesterase CpdA n=1 Tax=Alishewanella tabrizica TaxID=671278 RepID=A0ABQ2WL57_9ALTE|nr:metallophosphoesterase [Alishewanella tabrizica]GGW56309.1 3',5'-cyclic adenosine monophosphate phosphodiesterase CpdA [Alishewanella tabrizica]